MAVQALEVSMAADVADARATPKHAVLGEPALAGDGAATICPLLNRPCKEIP